MAEVFDTLREKSGNVEYSAKALAVVGEAMNDRHITSLTQAEQEALSGRC